MTGQCRTIFSLGVMVLAFFPTVLSADPSIQSASGSWDHKGTVTITGSVFGTKSPVEPLVWDACDGDSTDDLNTFYNTAPGGTMPNECPVNPSETPFLMDYRSSFHGYSDMPHSRVSKFLSAAHISCDGAWSSGWANNCVTVVGWDNADQLYLRYYYRLSEEFSDKDSADGYNLKEISANWDDAYLNPPQNYNGPTNEPVQVYPDDVQMRDDLNNGNMAYANPMRDWIHVEWLWDTEGNWYYWNSLPGSVHGARAGGGQSGTRSIHFNGDTQSISIGGYNRFPRVSGVGNYRFWTALYLDKTYARVMLGNDPNWDGCTIREPQIPQNTWDDSTVEIQVNLGAFNDNDTAYLFVFDSNNVHNEPGYEVTLGSGPPAGDGGIDPAPDGSPGQPDGSTQGGDSSNGCSCEVVGAGLHHGRMISVLICLLLIAFCLLRSWTGPKWPRN